MKTELEEVAENYSRITLNKNGLMSDKQVNGFIAGAKYQAERSYNKEDLEKAYEHGKLAIIDMGHGDTFEEWFEQFKKKA
jgi:hypothetical protein